MVEEYCSDDPVGVPCSGGATSVVVSMKALGIRIVVLAAAFLVVSAVLGTLLRAIAPDSVKS